jgi:uncharacterized DUF497 family protein
VKNFEWNEEKNEWIKKNRNISFEEQEYYFIKTVIPNREAKKKYMEGQNG